MGPATSRVAAARNRADAFARLVARVVYSFPAMRRFVMPRSLVTGGTGFIGRWLLVELSHGTDDVIAIVRRASERRDELLAWIKAHGGTPERVTVIEGDLAAPELGLDADGKRLASDVRDVFHLGAVMQFGMTEALARNANVAGTRALVELALASPALRRFVHVSGFKIGDDVAQHQLGLDPEAPFTAAAYDRLYQQIGSYEASKLESDHLVRDAARTRGLPLTRIHPGAVIGDARTGETTQFFGFSPLVEAAWRGKLPAVPGKAHHWLPLVCVDFLAALIARVPEHAETRDGSYIVLDDTSPQLVDLIGAIGERLGVHVPRRRVPLAVVRALARIGLASKADAEGLAFLGDRRYDAGPARRLAAAMGLAWPSIDDALARCIDFLVATRFGTKPTVAGVSRPRIAGAPTHVVGDRATADVVLLHGLPLDADSWDPVAAHLGGTHLRADLPGCGRSASVGASPLEWMEALLADATRPLVLVGHSLGTRYALEYATAHPDRVAGLVLISPFFVQKPPPSIMRWAPSARLAARGMRRRHIEALVAGNARAQTAVLDGPAADLARPGARVRFGQHLADAHRARTALQAALVATQLPTIVIAGERDPLVAATGSAEAITLAGTGHYPQLDLPAEVAAAIERLRGRVASAPIARAG
jgi:nucleoside-diphosphate-sugar epimerase/pimeloyl-ACP methyl ester carboxylesterase